MSPLSLNFHISLANRCVFSDKCYRGILNGSLDYVIQINPNASTYIVYLVHLRADMK